MSSERPGRFIEPPLLAETTPPPPDRILVRGARLVRVYGGISSRDVSGKPRPDGGREAVILAWARMPDRGWAVLMAWTSYWLYENPPHQTGLARWGWYVLDEERVKPRKPPRTLDEDAAWHGWATEGELQKAIDQAVLLLPPALREQALTPAQEPLG